MLIQSNQNIFMGETSKLIVICSILKLFIPYKMYVVTQYEKKYPQDLIESPKLSEPLKFWLKIAAAYGSDFKSSVLAVIAPTCNHVPTETLQKQIYNVWQRLYEYLLDAIPTVSSDTTIAPAVAGEAVSATAGAPAAPVAPTAPDTTTAT